MTSGKIVDGAVTAGKIAGGTIVPAHLDPAYGLWKKGPGDCPTMKAALTLAPVATGASPRCT